MTGVCKKKLISKLEIKFSDPEFNRSSMLFSVVATPWSHIRPVPPGRTWLSSVR